MLGHGLVICNGKGGVGKTSLAAGLAAGVATTGRRTLLVDLDPLGSLDQDLGYRQTGESDDGRGLYRAAVDHEALTPLEGVRTDLDVVAAGDFTQAVYCRIANHELAIADAVAPLEHLGAGYDVVVVDTPPANRLALDLAFCLCRSMLMPVGVDTGSLDGLELVSDRYHVTRGRGLNPDLAPLGVVLFGMDPSQPRLHREVRADVEWELDGAAPVLEPFIRSRPRAARDLRRHGLVAGEYLRAARDARDDPDRIPGADAYDDDAVGLAEDYWDLTEDVLGRLDARAGLTADVSPVGPGATPDGSAHGGPILDREAAGVA